MPTYKASANEFTESVKEIAKSFTDTLKEMRSAGPEKPETKPDLSGVRERVQTETNAMMEKYQELAAAGEYAKAAQYLMTEQSRIQQSLQGLAKPEDDPGYKAVFKSAQRQAKKDNADIFDKYGSEVEAEIARFSPAERLDPDTLPVSHAACAASAATALDSSSAQANSIPRALVMARRPCITAPMIHSTPRMAREAAASAVNGNAAAHQSSAVVRTSTTEKFDLLRDAPDLRDRLGSNTRYFRERLRDAGFRVAPGAHPIVPIMLGDEKLAHAMPRELFEAGIYVVGFSHPVVPHGEARIRVQISAVHERDDLDRAVGAFADIGRRHGIV